MPSDATNRCAGGFPVEIFFHISQVKRIQALRVWGVVMLQEAVNDNQRVMTLINTLSGTLRNIDAEFDYELARARSTTRPDIRPVVVDTVRRRHQQRREPYVQKLAELRCRVKTLETRA